MDETITIFANQAPAVLVQFHAAATACQFPRKKIQQLRLQFLSREKDAAAAAAFQRTHKRYKLGNDCPCLLYCKYYRIVVPSCSSFQE